MSHDAFISDVARLLGRRGWTRDGEAMEAWLTDWRGRYTGRAIGLASPDIDAALVDVNLSDGATGPIIGERLANEFGIRVVFVTANPGMVLPDIEHGDAVVPKPFSRNGLMTALSFLERGINAPPPDMPPPEGFIPNRTLQARWELA